METEIKILEVDPDAVVARLERLGATRLFEGEMESRYYDRNGELRGAGIVLRLRREGASGVLAVKRTVPDARYKVMDEHETSVDFDEAARMLELLGFSIFARQRKHRTSYRLGSARIDIDVYRERAVPPFLEIEGDPEAIESAIPRLGLEDHRRVSWGGRELREHYGLG